MHLQVVSPPQSQLSLFQPQFPHLKTGALLLLQGVVKRIELSNA